MIEKLKIKEVSKLEGAPPPPPPQEKKNMSEVPQKSHNFFPLGMLSFKVHSTIAVWEVTGGSLDAEMILLTVGFSAKKVRVSGLWSHQFDFDY